MVCQNILKYFYHNEMQVSANTQNNNERENHTGLICHLILLNNNI